jgi:hypothetical protein
MRANSFRQITNHSRVKWLEKKVINFRFFVHFVKQFTGFYFYLHSVKAEMNDLDHYSWYALYAELLRSQLPNTRFMSTY